MLGTYLSPGPFRGAGLPFVTSAVSTGEQVDATLAGQWRGSTRLSRCSRPETGGVPLRPLSGGERSRPSYSITGLRRPWLSPNDGGLQIQTSRTPWDSRSGGDLVAKTRTGATGQDREGR